MKNLNLTILFLFLYFSASEINSQNNYTQIYHSGNRFITDVHKVILPNLSDENFYIILSPIDQYSPESILRLNVFDNIFYQNPHHGFVTSGCAISMFGVSCGKLLEFMSSTTDTNILLRAATDPWWEPAGSIKITENGGISSRVLFSNSFQFRYYGMSFDPNNDSIIYAGWNYFDSIKTLYKSTNRGNSWIGLSQVNFNTSFYNFPLIRINPFNSSVIFIALNNSILRSSDGGYNFQSVETGSFKEIVYDYTDSLIYFVSGNGIYRTSQNGNTWKKITNAIFNTIKIDHVENHIIYGGNQFGLFKSTDMGVSWSLYNNLFTPSKNVIGIVKNISMGDSLIVSTNKGVYKVFGAAILDSSSLEYFPLKTGNRWIYNFYEYLNPTPTIHRMTVSNDTIINNKNYYKVTGSIIPQSSLLRVDPVSGVLYQYSPGCVNNEKVIDSLSSRFGDTARGCFSEKKILIDTGSINQFGVSTYYKTFSESFLMDLGKKYVKRFGLNTLTMTEPPPKTSYYSLKGCVLDGIVYGDTIMTRVSLLSNIVPDRYMLHQNYPNPFNPSTKIKFEIPSGISNNGEVVLGVYDILGRKIVTLINENLSPGTYEVEFNTQTEILSSGIYFYKLTLGENIITKSMMLLK